MTLNIFTATTQKVLEYIEFLPHFKLPTHPLSGNTQPLGFFPLFQTHWQKVGWQ